MSRAETEHWPTLLQVNGFFSGAYPDHNGAVKSSGANAEIAEIDARLQALQSFLKAAKASCNLKNDVQ